MFFYSKCSEIIPTQMILFFSPIGVFYSNSNNFIPTLSFSPLLTGLHFDCNEFIPIHIILYSSPIGVFIPVVMVSFQLKLPIPVIFPQVSRLVGDIRRGPAWGPLDIGMKSVTIVTVYSNCNCSFQKRFLFHSACHSIGI